MTVKEKIKKRNEEIISMTKKKRTLFRRYFILIIVLAIFLGFFIFGNYFGEDDSFISGYSIFDGSFLDYSGYAVSNFGLEDVSFAREREIKKVNFVSELKKGVDNRGNVRLLIKEEGIFSEDLKNSRKVKKKLENYHVLEIKEKDLDKLIDSGEIKLSSVSLDYSFDYFLDDSMDYSEISFLKNEVNLRGEGVKICVIDTGANEENLGFEIKGYNVFDGSEDISTNLNHGNLMARIIHEISPEAEILMAKVFDEEGNSYASDVLAGLEWCEEQNPDIISMSIGGGLFEGICIDDPVALKVSQLHWGGILMVAAAGNDGSLGLSSPACALNVLSVGSSFKNESISDFSNSFGNLDLLASGELVGVVNSYGEKEMVSGTSVSAAIVSGGSALILADRNVTSTEFEKGIISSGELVSGIPFFNVKNYFEGNVLNNYSSEIDVFVEKLYVDSFDVEATCGSFSYNYHCSGGSPIYTASGEGMFQSTCKTICESYSSSCCSWEQVNQNPVVYLCMVWDTASRVYTGGDSYAATCSSCVCSSGTCCDGCNYYSGDYCGTCQYCTGSSSTCSNIPAGEDYYGDCPAITCTNYVYGWSGNSCLRYSSSTSYNGDCYGTGACATVTQSCTGAGSTLATCGSSECKKSCPAGGVATSYDSISEICYTSGQNSCPSGQECDSTGTCVTALIPNGGSCSSGSNCQSGLCISGICRASCSGYNSAQCSTTTTAWNSYGLCSQDTCRTGLMYATSSSNLYYPWNSYTNYDYDNDASGDSCDTSVSGGAYSPNGMLVYSGGNYDSGHCYTGSQVRVDASNNNYFVATCDASLDLCDTAISSSYTPFSADGRCVGSTCATSGAVCLYNVPGGPDYYTPIACPDLSPCDKSRTGTNPFVQDGVVCGESCVGFPSSNCCSNSDCSTNQYCSTSAYSCIALPTCAKQSGTNSYTYQSSNEDLFGECPSGSSCLNQYQISSTDGYCSGTSYSCKSETTSSVASGSVCKDGASAVTDGTSSCGTGSQACWCSNSWYQCDSVNDCNYDRTRVGFNSAGGCVFSSAYDSVYSFNVANPSGYRCNVGTTTAYSSYTSIMDTNSCRSAAGECDTADYCSGGTCTDNKLTGKQSCSTCQECDGINNYCQSIVMNECSSFNSTFNSFSVKNSSNYLFRVNSAGDVWIAGELYSGQSSLSSTLGSYSLKNLLNNEIFYIDKSDGSVYHTGSVSSSVSPIIAGVGDFLVQNNLDSSYIFKVDNSGNIQSKGSVGYCCSASFFPLFYFLFISIFQFGLLIFSLKFN